MLAMLKAATNDYQHGTRLPTMGRSNYRLCSRQVVLCSNRLCSRQVVLYSRQDTAPMLVDLSLCPLGYFELHGDMSMIALPGLEP